MPGKVRERRRGVGERGSGSDQLDRRERGARVEQVVATGDRAAAARGRGDPASKRAPDATPRQDVEVRIREHERAPRGRLAEAAEGVEQLGPRRPARVVVELDVGDHRDLGSQAQEARVALVRLGDDPLACAPSRRWPARRRARRPAARRRAGTRGRRRWRAGRERASRRWSSCRACPATAMRRRSAHSSASSSPRCITRWPRSRARASSGLSSPTAVETTTSAPAGTASASWPIRGSSPAARAAACTRTRRGRCRSPWRRARSQTSARPLMPGAADRDEVEPAAIPDQSLSRRPSASLALRAPRRRSARRRRDAPATATPPPSARGAGGSRAAALPSARERLGRELGVVDARPPRPLGHPRGVRAPGGRAAACGYGTRIAGRPAAASSKTEPPARASDEVAGGERVAERRLVLEQRVAIGVGGRVERLPRRRRSRGAR